MLEFERRKIMEIKFDEKGLIPAIIQDSKTGEVLMLGYMNKEALEKTIEEGKVYFYSRSRKKLWMKGETSKNYLYVTKIFIDCDRDTLLILVNPEGNVCHTGNRSCFFEEISSGSNPPLYNFIYKLFSIIEDRKKSYNEKSYTSYLFQKGREVIAKKVGEEAMEVIIAYLNEDSEEIIKETSDLVYHLLILLSSSCIEPQKIFEELINRNLQGKQG